MVDHNALFKVYQIKCKSYQNALLKVYQIKSKFHIKTTSQNIQNNALPKYMGTTAQTSWHMKLTITISTGIEKGGREEWR